MKTIIYCATNTITNKQYIGLTSRPLKVRIKQHYEVSSPCVALKRALIKYGEDAFIWSIIHTCQESDNPLELEEFYIKKLNTLAPNGYNLMSESNGIRTISEETRRKMSEAQKGRKLSDETKRRMSESAKRVPNEIRRQNALGNKNRAGKKASDETRKKLSESHKGRQHTEEQKLKISRALTGNKNAKKLEKVLDF